MNISICSAPPADQAWLSIKVDPTIFMSKENAFDVLMKIAPPKLSMFESYA
jgi:hypothetical protein